MTPNLPQKRIGANISLVRLTLEEAPAMQQMYHRPYQPVITDRSLNILNDRIDRVSGGSPVVELTGSLLAGIDQGLMLPSAAPESNVIIPYGWACKRFRFVLVVEIMNPLQTNPFRYYFQGYTDMMDVSFGDHINPDTRCFINSYTKTSVYTDPRTGQSRESMLATGDVVNGRLVSSSESTDVYTLRPQDIFQGIQGNAIAAGYSSLGGTCDDTRVRQSNNTVLCNREHNVPSSYMAEMLNAHNLASSAISYNNDVGSVYGRAIAHCQDASGDENEFLRLLSNNRGFFGVSDFTLSELEKIDNTIGSRSFITPPTMSVGQFDPLNSDTWNSADYSTQRSAMIVNSVISLMNRLKIVHLRFDSHNQTLDNSVITTFSSWSIMSSEDPAEYLTLFKMRFETEVIPDLTMGGIVSYMLSVTADIYGVTYISLSINGELAVPRAFPSYASSLMSPMLSSDRNNFNNMLSVAETVLSHRDQAGLSQNLASLLHTFEEEDAAKQRAAYDLNRHPTVVTVDNFNRHNPHDPIRTESVIGNIEIRPL